MVSGTPGLQRLSMVVKQNVKEKRDPMQIWIARGKESSISGLNFGGNKGNVSSTQNFQFAFIIRRGKQTKLCCNIDSSKVK